jgi:hypothetical protein
LSLSSRHLALISLSRAALPAFQACEDAHACMAA